MTIPWWHPVLGDEEAQRSRARTRIRFSERRRGNGTVRSAHRIDRRRGPRDRRLERQRGNLLRSRRLRCSRREMRWSFPDLTFVATANAVRLAGARPVLADIRPTDFSLDPAAVEKVLTPKTRAIVPVHVNGRGGSIEEIVALAGRHVWLSSRTPPRPSAHVSPAGRSDPSVTRPRFRSRRRRS